MTVHRPGQYAPKIVAGASFVITNGPTRRQLWDIGARRGTTTFYGYVVINGAPSKETSFTARVTSVENLKYGPDCRVVLTADAHPDTPSFSFMYNPVPEPEDGSDKAYRTNPDLPVDGVPELTVDSDHKKPALGVIDLSGLKN